MNLWSLISISISVYAIVMVAGVAIIRKHLHDVPIERTNTVTDEFIDKPIPPGVYLICGPQGVGKTSFMNALISIDFKYHSEQRLQYAKAEIDRLNNSGYKLTLPQCAYRTRSKLFLPNGKPTYHTDISQFGLPGRRSEVQYFPPYTVIGCDEIDSFMDCREWNKNASMKADIIDGFKYIRHHDLVFLGDLQNLSKVDVAVRKLATDVIYILNKKDMYGKKRRFSRKQTLLRTEWEFIWVKHQQAENAESLREMGIDVHEKNARRCKLIYEGNIYSQYNSQSGKPYWYRGIKQFSIEKHPENTLSPEGVEKYCRQNSLNYDGGQEKQGNDVQSK